MNHKRGKAKQHRAGCLFCKPHKGNHSKLFFREKGSSRRKPQMYPDGQERKPALTRRVKG